MESTIHTAIDLHFTDFAANSDGLFKQAREYNERGVFICYFESVAQLMSSTESSLIFTSQKQAERLNDATLTDFISTYNPEVSVVVYIFVTVQKDNVLTKPGIIHKNAYKAFSKENTFIDEAKDLPKSQCVFCGKTSDQIKKCGRCKSVYYCDGSCQKEDWPKHKLLCKVFKESLVEVISTLQ